MTSETIPQLVAKFDSAKMTLRYIRKNYGAVCINFGTCKHRSCRDSYAAWAEADACLRAID